MLFVFIASLAVAVTTAQQMLVFSDDFDSLDTTKWEHELTMGGGGVSDIFIRIHRIYVLI